MQFFSYPFSIVLILLSNLTSHRQCIPHYTSYTVQYIPTSQRIHDRQVSQPMTKIVFYACGSSESKILRGSK